MKLSFYISLERRPPMFEWYCEENVSYVRNLLDTGQVPVFWSDAGCYYWAPSVVIPSGNVCDFFCYNNQYAPKHQPCDIAYFIINPTLEQMEELDRQKREEAKAKWEERQRKARLKEASATIGKCMKALILMDKMHREYFTQ